MVRMVKLEIRGGYHHGTKETIFGFWGFGDITFSFAPVTFPLDFLSFCFFATECTITILPSPLFLFCLLLFLFCLLLFLALYQFTRPATYSKVYRKPDGLKQIDFLSILEARVLKSRCLYGYASSEGSGEKSFIASASFWWFPAILGISWLVDLSLQPLSLCLYSVLPCVPLCLHMAFSSLCVYAQLSLFF